MTYLGTARWENGQIELPDAFASAPRAQTYEATDIGGDILLVASPFDRKRWERIQVLADASIADHRQSLDGLAK